MVTSTSHAARPATPNVLLENGLTRIANVPKLSWRTCTQSTFAGALAAATAVTDHPLSARDIQGFTALAFRTRWLYYEGTRRWCPSCPVGECQEEMDAVARNLGWRLDCSMGPDEGKLPPQRRAQIAAAIDGGIPSVIYDPTWNCAVAYGQRAAGQALLVDGYGDLDGEIAADQLPPFAVLLVEYRPVPDRRRAVRDALQMAVANWRTDHKHNGAATYWYGRAAYEHWIDDVAHAELTAEASPCFATWWNVDVMLDARRLGGEWLAEAASEFGAADADHLRRAAELCTDVHHVLANAWFGGRMDGDRAKWTAEYRAGIAAVLRQAQGLEARAAEELAAVAG